MRRGARPGWTQRHAWPRPRPYGLRLSRIRHTRSEAWLKSRPQIRRGGLFSYNGNALADGSRFFAGSQEWEIDYNASAGGLNFTADYLPSSSFVTVTAVPEPTTLAVVGIATTIGLIARRKRT